MLISRSTVSCASVRVGSSLVETFAWLRNRTRGHGATTANQYLDTVGHLEESIRSVTDNVALLKLPWAFVRQNLTGKYQWFHWDRMPLLLSS